MAAIVALYFLTFYAYVMRVSLDIGRLPAYNFPDPTYMYIQHRAAVHLVGSAALWTIIFGVLLSIALFLLRRLNRDFAWKLFITLTTLFTLHIIGDPLVEWFFD